MTAQTKFRQLILVSALALASVSSYAISIVPTPSASVADTVSTVGSSWLYSYTVSNTTECALCNPSFSHDVKNNLVEFALPYFSDAGITAITAPTGWSFAVVDSDLFDNINKAIVWTSDTKQKGIAVGSFLSGFSYRANYSAGKGPFVTLDGWGSSVVGDPAVPLSPLAIQAGIQPMTPVDEPTSFAMLLAGLGLMGGIAARRRSQML